MVIFDDDDDVAVEMVVYDNGDDVAGEMVVYDDIYIMMKCLYLCMYGFAYFLGKLFLAGEFFSFKTCSFLFVKYFFLFSSIFSKKISIFFEFFSKFF